LRRAKTAFATIFVATLAATYLLAAVRLDQAATSAAAPSGEATVGLGLPFIGEASYYGAELAGQATASGEIFDPGLLTAAHRTLPLGSEVQVTNLENGLSTRVRINDRGPFTGAMIDLSTAAAERLGMLPRGSARVQLTQAR
jgi:rare lipoprotein A